MTALAGEPLPVELRHGDVWHPGVLLGWRHDPDGACWMRVRFVVGGLRRTGWIPLADLRLAEAADPAPAPRTRPDLLLPGREWPRPAPPRSGELSRV